MRPEKALSALLLAGTLALYWPVVGHDFIELDDPHYVTANTTVQRGLGVRSVLWALESMESSNWHPVTWWSHMLDCDMYGLHPAGHHLTSLFFHAANALLLFLLLRETTGCLWRSFVVAAVFSVHPLRVESVAWIAERKDVLSGFFFLLTLLTYVRFLHTRSRIHYLGVAIAFGMGLMSKPMLVTLPLVMLLLDYWPLGRGTNGGHLHGACPGARSVADVGKKSTLLWEKAPLMLLSLLSCVVTYAAQSAGGALSKLDAVPLDLRILNAFTSYGRYIYLTFAPHDLAVFYPHPGTALNKTVAVGCLFVLLATSTLVHRCRKTAPYLAAGWLWFLGMLVPVIGVVQVGGQSMADRYTYLPSIGLYIMIAWGLPALLKPFPFKKQALIGGLCLGLLLLGSGTRNYLEKWENSETLFKHAVSVTQRNHLSHCLLGVVYLEDGRLEAARNAFIQALEIWPGYADAHVNLGLVSLRQGRPEEAVTQYRQALEANPTHFHANLNMGYALHHLGENEEAYRFYRRCIRNTPAQSEAQNALGVLLALLGKRKEAGEHFRKAMGLCPHCAAPLVNMGWMLVAGGEVERGLQYLLRAVMLDPKDASAHNNLGVALGKAGDLEQGIYHLSVALRLDPDYGKARANLLGLAHALTGSETPGKETGAPGAKSPELFPTHDAGSLARP